MSINKRTFAYRLNLYIVSLLTIIAAVIFGSYLIISRNFLLESAENTAANIAELNAKKIESILVSTETIALNMDPIVESRELNDEELLFLIRNIVQNNESVFGSTIAFEPFSYDKSKYYYSPYYYKDNGELHYKNLGTTSYEYFFQDWYQIPKYLGRAVWSEPYFDEGGGNILMSTFSVPFYRYEGDQKRFWGILTVDISLDWLEKIVSSVKIYETGFAFVISSSGTIIIHPDSSFIMNESIFSIAEENNDPELREIGREMIHGESGFKPVHSLTTDYDSYIEYIPLHDHGWSIAVIFPEAELYADLNQLSLIIIIIGLLGLGIILFSVAKVSTRLTRPLHSLSEAAKLIGSGNLEADLPKISTSDEIEDLYNSFLKMQGELKHYIENLKRTTADKEKIESELRIANQIQMGMIPKIFPPFPDRDDIDLHAFLEPAKEVGGDLYDFFFIDDNKLVVVVGDVAGKGVPASLFMAVTRTLIRSKMIKGVSLKSVVDQVNKNLQASNTSRLFVTLFICIVDLDTRTLEFTNAGHNYPYIASPDGRVKPIEVTHGMALGVFDIKPYESETITVNPGDKLVLYTDGVNEAMNTSDEMYDYPRFEKVLCESAKLSSKETTSIVLSDIKDFTEGAEQSDDITLLVMRID